MTLRELIFKIYRSSDVREGNGGEISVCCPFCIELVGKRDDKHRLGINTSTGIGNCFRCEKKHAAKNGRAYWFRELCRVFKVNYQLSSEERDDAESETNRNDQPLENVPAVAKPVQLPDEYEALWKNVNDSIGKRARSYLRSRGITEEEIRRNRIGFAAVGKYAYRVIFPVYSPKGKLKAFVARDFSGQAELRYLNSEGAKCLYGLPKKKARSTAAILVEGIFDQLAAYRCLGPKYDVIACLGKTLSKKQVKILSSYETITIWPDPDAPGIDSCIKRAIALQKKTKAYVVPPSADIETETDLGAMRAQEIHDKFNTEVMFSPSVAALMRLRVAEIRPQKLKRNKSSRPAYHKV